MRLDHIAYRTKDRYKTAQFFADCFSYTTGTEFGLKFDDGTAAECVALVPPEVRHPETRLWTHFSMMGIHTGGSVKAEYHAAPEIFVSDGPVGSIVGDWVEARNGIGGIHHIAYQVDDVKAVMEAWKENGYAEFLSEDPMECPGLKQVFTKPSELTGIIYELISREGEGFCEDNVKALMEATKELS